MMNSFRRKKVLFVGSDNNLLKFFSGDNDTEVISSITFLDTVLFNFLPDLIVFVSSYELNLKFVRENPKLCKVPVLVVAENFVFFSDFLELCNVPGVLVLNNFFISEEGIKKHLQDVIEKSKPVLPCKTGRCVKNAVLYINKNFSRSFTREEIAAACGVAGDYLSRVFTKETGVKLWDYVNSFRLFEAKHMLMQTGYSVKEIAFRTGFDDAAYFTRLFTRKFGTSPSRFRNNK